MAKYEMSHPEQTNNNPRNDHAAVQENQGKAAHGNVEARPIITGTFGLELKVYHEKPHEDKTGLYSGYDTDLAADNLENDLPEADMRSF